MPPCWAVHLRLAAARATRTPAEAIPPKAPAVQKTAKAATTLHARLERMRHIIALGLIPAAKIEDNIFHWSAMGRHAHLAAQGTQMLASLVPSIAIHFVVVGMVLTAFFATSSMSQSYGSDERNGREHSARSAV
mmetsp:Transcript_32541/g.74350  ORF Transcript_32541/g.74350 Transcript_32541/m.74350 type:complete len:134 (-) Transcript_32541:742-1143(-)